MTVIARGSAAQDHGIFTVIARGSAAQDQGIFTVIARGSAAQDHGINVGPRIAWNSREPKGVDAMKCSL